MSHSAFRIIYIEARAIQFDVNARPILDGVGFTISLAGWRLNRKFHSPFAFYNLNSLIRNFTQLQFYNAFGCAKITTEKRSWFIISCYVLYVFLFVSPFFGAHELVVYACTVSRVFMYLSMFDGISMGIELLTDEMRHTPKWEIWRFIWISVNFTEMLYFQYKKKFKKKNKSHLKFP